MQHSRSVASRRDTAGGAKAVESHGGLVSSPDDSLDASTAGLDRNESAQHLRERVKQEGIDARNLLKW